MDAPTPTAPPALPERLGRYAVGPVIGEGGMGVVHLGTRTDGCLVAIKMLRPWVVGGADVRARFAREVATLARVRGPLVAEVLDADVRGDPPYIVTRYVPGPTLDHIVRMHGPLRRSALLHVAAGLAEALAVVHRAGIVHRDVKPGNVLLDEGDPVLIDFGVARVLGDSPLTSVGMVVGTPGYLAPEVISGHPPSGATDIHGWGATLAFAATGRPPFGSGPDVVVLGRVQNGEHDLRGVDAALAPLVRRALEVRPEQRPSLDEVRAAMAALRARGSDRPDDATADTWPRALRPPVPTRIEPAPAPRASFAPVPSAGPAAVPAAAPAAAPVRPLAAPVPLAASPVRPLAAPVPYAAPAYARFERPRAPRTGPLFATLAALAALAVCATPVAPYVTLGVVGAALVVARTTDRAGASLRRRRDGLGQRRSDAVVVAAKLPWHGAVAVLATTVHLVGVWLAAWWGGLVVAALWGGPRVPLLAAGGFGVLAACWLPGTTRVRSGARSALLPLARRSRWGWLAVGLIAALAWGLMLWWESFGTTWWPANGAPPVTTWLGL